MVGRPKFNYGEKVSFEIDGKTYVGEVAIIDAWGTFFITDEVCYDVMVEGVGLFKHLRQTSLTKVL